LGSTTGYAIANNQLDVGSGNDLYWTTSFGSSQEVFVTLSAIDATASEIDLLLKAQGSTWTAGLIEVWYQPSRGTVEVWTYTSAQDWVQRGAAIPVTFQAGDVFGARARTNGTVEVYRNGGLVGTANVSGWPYYASGGRIGLWLISAAATVLDDFGGGNSAVSYAVPSVMPREAFRSLAYSPAESVSAAAPAVVVTPPAGQTWKKYYALGGKRVALRVATNSSDTLYYLHGDHLGSSSLTTSNTGTKVAELRYLPFGGMRWESGTTPTDFRFTGQRQESGFGLYDYNARYYDPLIGRFISADSIVPGAGNPQVLNRYSYVYNNPVKYVDPTGHRASTGDDDEGGQCPNVVQCLEGERPDYSEVHAPLPNYADNTTPYYSESYEILPGGGIRIQDANYQSEVRAGPIQIKSQVEPGVEVRSPKALKVLTIGSVNRFDFGDWGVNDKDEWVTRRTNSVRIGKAGAKQEIVFGYTPSSPDLNFSVAIMTASSYDFDTLPIPFWKTLDIPWTLEGRVNMRFQLQVKMDEPFLPLIGVPARSGAQPQLQGPTYIRASGPFSPVFGCGGMCK
jgi:RHS repeat-associated protein